ncbi:MAG: DUF2950 domain-containing protein [Candidatus Omnitrophica bacterium]|nr:DUF2950 domain-containing protein [Candidatus Omnitrophota bacterium]
MTGSAKRRSGKHSGKINLLGFFLFLAAIIFCTVALGVLKALEDSYREMVRAAKGITVPAVVQDGSAGAVVCPPAAARARQLSVFDVLSKQWCAWRIVADARRQRTRNEQEAVALLRRYAAAQQVYCSRTGGFAAQAAELILNEAGQLRIIDPELAPVNRSVMAKMPVEGYYFLYVRGGSSPRPALLAAVPAEYGVSGKYTFAVDVAAGGSVAAKDTQGRAPEFAEEVDASWRPVR